MWFGNTASFQSEVNISLEQNFQYFTYIQSLIHPSHLHHITFIHCSIDSHWIIHVYIAKKQCLFVSISKARTCRTKFVYYLQQKWCLQRLSMYQCKAPDFHTSWKYFNNEMVHNGFRAFNICPQYTTKKKISESLERFTCERLCALGASYQPCIRKYILQCLTDDDDDP